MDFRLTLESLSVADIPRSGKSSFILTSSSVVRSELSISKAFIRFKAILDEQQVITCSNRIQFISWCATTFVALYQNKLHGVGHCAIVVGERGNGKSYLLEKIVAATVDLVPNTIVCYMNYKMHEEFNTR